MNWWFLKEIWKIFAFITINKNLSTILIYEVGKL